MVHTIFGYTLMAAGLSRIIEVCFVLNDKNYADEPKAFQHLCPYVSDRTLIFYSIITNRK